MDDIKRILVVCRMIEDCRTAVHYGVLLSEKYGAELSVLHVIHNPFGLQGWNLPIPSLEEEYKRILQDTKKELDDIIRDEKKRGVSIKELIREGESTEEILKAVKEENIDFLILPAHKEGRIEHFLFGRSNEELIREMPCSILMVKMEPEPVNY